MTHIKSDSGELYSDQIEKYMSKVPHFIGWFMRDNLPRYSSGSMIINTDKQSGQGIHWIGLYDSPDSETIEYFDPFGMVPIPEVEKYMRESGKVILYNNRQLQDILSELCGWYCMYYILERTNGRSPYDVIMDFTQKPSETNESMIDKFGTNVKRVHGGRLGGFLDSFNLNSFINNLPFEAHLIDQGDDGRIRRVNFVGPGTKLDKRVKLDEYGNIQKIYTPPINKLDEGAMKHDIAYTLYNDMANRNIADMELKEVADEVYRNSKSNLQRANAALVSLIMKTKIKYGI